MSAADGLVDAVGSGDRRRALTALRDHLAEACAAAEPRELAPLSKQLTDVMRELDSLPLGKEASDSDALAARRAKRLAGRSASSAQ